MLFKEFKPQKPIVTEDAASEIVTDNVFKFSYSDATEIWPNLCAIKDVFNNNEDALTEIILNFRNVRVILAKDNATIVARQTKSCQHMPEKCIKRTNSWTILHSIVVFIFTLKLRFVKGNQVHY